MRCSLAVFEQPADTDSELPPPLFYVPSPDDIRVRLRVTAEIAPWLSDYGGMLTNTPAGLPVESSRDIRGGKRELSFRTSALAWLEKLLLRFGDDIEVLEPPELAERTREAAERILALYQRPKKK